MAGFFNRKPAVSVVSPGSAPSPSVVAGGFAPETISQLKKSPLAGFFNKKPAVKVVAPVLSSADAFSSMIEDLRESDDNIALPTVTSPPESESSLRNEEPIRRAVVATV